MLLNYQYQQNANPSAKTMVLIHGLFGSLTNLGMLARAFSEQYSILQLDVRNHGKSQHAIEMNYDLMAQDVIETLDDLNIETFTVIGHSMGGKIAMKLSDIVPQRVEKLIVLDISPAKYAERHHEEIFQALFAVQNAKPSSRLEAANLMRQFIGEEMVIQFLLKSWHKDQIWLFNLDAIFKHYLDILDWQPISAVSLPTLFLKGAQSPYITSPVYRLALETQFPQAQLKTVPEAGHWLHAEQTALVVELIEQFLN